MAVRTNTTISTDLQAAVGGTINAGDEVHIDRAATTFTAGTNQSAKDLLKFWIKRGSMCEFSAEAGGGLQLVLDQSAAGMFINEGGQRRVDLRSIDSTAVVKTIEIAPGRGDSVTTLDQLLNSTLRVQSGHTLVQPAAYLNDAMIYGGTTRVRPAAANTPGTITVIDGQLELSRDVTTLSIMGGVATLDDDETVSGPSVSPTTVDLRGGTLKLVRCGNITTLNGFAGTLDLSQLCTPMTISTLVEHPSLTVLWGSATPLPAITTRTMIRGGARWVRTG